MSYTFNLEALASDFIKVCEKRSTRTVRIGKKQVPQPRSLLSIESETGISRATLSRLQRRIAYPDMDTLLAVCSWMGVSPRKYFEQGK
jgi:transcriptional regulator with XRE-family HTH domain